MNARQKRTLEAIFTLPTPSNIRWNDVVSLIASVGEIDEKRSGSRVAFTEQLEFYFEVCKKRGKKPDRPYSGQFVLRVDPEIHRAIAVAADREDKSLNSWAAETLARAAGG
jgi:predicted HicB family RNase H-like nuclease